MAESDRSRSPMPLRNRLEPRGQVPAPALPFFPRWCGPMSASVRHFQNMPRTQQRPNWSGNSSGPYMTGRMWSQPPPNPPSSWMSQQFPPLPPHNSLPPTLPHPPQPCPSTQPCPPTIPCPPTQPSSPGTPSISPSQPRSNATPKSNPPSRPGNNEATKTYGVDPNPHWQEDRDHYDNQNINGLSFPRSIRQSAFTQKLDIEGCDPLSLPLAAMMYQQANDHWLRKLAHGRELYLIPTGDIAAVVFTTELLTQLRNRGIDLDRVSHLKARQDGKLLDGTANTKYAAQQIAELIQSWLPARTTDPDFQHEITQLRNQLAIIQTRMMVLAVIHGLRPNQKLKSILKGCTDLTHLWGSTLTAHNLFSKPFFQSQSVYLRFTHIMNMQPKFYIGSAMHHTLDREYSRSRKFCQLTNDRLAQAELALRYWKEHDNLYIWAPIPIFTECADYRCFGTIQEWQPHLNYPFICQFFHPRKGILKRPALNTNAQFGLATLWHRSKHKFTPQVVKDILASDRFQHRLELWTIILALWDQIQRLDLNNPRCFDPMMEVLRCAML